LPCEEVARRKACRKQIVRPFVSVQGQPEPISLRYVPLAVPDGPQQGRVELAQSLFVDLQVPLERCHLHKPWDGHLMKPRFARALDVTEVLLWISIDFQRSEEGDVEVTGRETESPSLVVAHDLDDVVGAQGFLCPANTLRAVVVCRQSKRPGTQKPI